MLKTSCCESIKVSTQPGQLQLEGTELAKAQCTTIRVNLLMVGTRIRVSVRRVCLSFSEAYPYVSDWAQILANIRHYPAWAPPG